MKSERDVAEGVSSPLHIEVTDVVEEGLLVGDLEVLLQMVVRFHVDSAVYDKRPITLLCCVELVSGRHTTLTCCSCMLL